MSLLHPNHAAFCLHLPSGGPEVAKIAVTGRHSQRTARILVEQSLLCAVMTVYCCRAGFLRFKEKVRASQPML